MTTPINPSFAERLKGYSLAITIFIVTAVLVVVGYAYGEKLKVVYMSSGSSLGHEAPAGTPAAAVQSLYANAQRRDFDAAYLYVGNKQDVDKDTFIRDLNGVDGNLRTFSALHDFQTSTVQRDGGQATVRAQLQWATGVGAFYETRDFQVHQGNDGWRVDWISDKQVRVPPQVIPVTYPRWDLIRPDAADVVANEKLPAPKVKIVSQNVAQDADTLVIVGEAENQDSVPAFVAINGSLQSADGKSLGEEGAFDDINHTLLPGARTPFRIEFPGVRREQAAHIKLDVSATVVPASGDPVVGLRGARLEDGEGGVKVFKGELLTQSGQVINIPQVLASFYDQSGKIVWVASTYLDRALMPQTPLAFSMKLPPEIAAQVRDFKVAVNTYRIDQP